MTTALELSRRGLRHGVIVDAAATPATLAAIERAGLRYKVEVASGITAADRATLDRRGLQYFVPVAATVSMADREILERQGLRYAVQVDPTVLPADLAILERQGLSYFVEVDSSGNAIATAAGGAILLVDEANGFATDFTHPVDAERVALKSSLGPEKVVNGAFDSDTSWTKGTGWTISGGVASHAAGTGANLSQAMTLTSGKQYVVTYTFTRTAGSMLVIFTGGGTNVNGSLRTSSGTFTETLTSTGNLNLVLQAQATTNGTIDNVSVKEVVSTTVVYSGTSFFTSSGTSSKWVYDINGTLVNIPVGTLPLDYDPVTHAAKGLLCEPVATNLVLQSNALSDAGIWSIEGGTVTANNQAGPDGTLIADTFTENTATGVHDAYGAATIVANTDYTVSRYYKMGTRRYATIGWSNGTDGAYAVYDLQSGVVGSSAAIGAGTLNSASMQALLNGWYRCILSGKFPTGTTGYFTFGTANAATITPDGFGRQSFLGTGATLFFGHGQLEAGTVATSPIPTLGVSVTRAADLPSVTPASINYSGTAGSWWIEVNEIAHLPAARLIGHLSGHTPIYLASTTAFGLSDGVATPSKTVTSVLGSHKVIAAFASADRAITADGLAPATNTTAGVALLSPGAAIGIGTDGWGPNHAYIRKIRYLPRRPSDAELQTMTA